jgi:type II secretory pathway predicted ATPase ExeA
MTNLIENLITRLWNQLSLGRRVAVVEPSLDLGLKIVDGQISCHRTVIATGKRTEHLAILGKTGSGKSYLLRHIAAQDVRAGRGFVFFDLHGDATPFLLRLVAAEEVRRRANLSDRLILIEPADRDFSVGLNVLEGQQSQSSFLQIAEFAQILKTRWKLDTFGARTEELLRNSLHLLADNGLTLLELSPLLTNATFRARCLRQATNPEVAAYFQSRYDQASEAMQAVFRDAILNKVSEFTSDPRFRHILGQQHSTFSLVEAIDNGHWVLLNLDKARLGEQAATLGSLLLTKLKNALFARKTRHLFTLFCDEIQNLVAYDSGIDTLLSEARKFGVSIVTANQFLDQYPAQIRSAILSVGTHIFFQLSSSDADKIAQGLDGGKVLAQLLKNLRPRHLVVKSGHHRWHEVRVPDLAEPRADIADLYSRCRRRWTRPRAEVEQAIRARHAAFGRASNEVLHDWE